MLDRNKINKQQNGGRFLGEGGFGCVVSPSIKCRSSTRSFYNMFKGITQVNANANTNANFDKNTNKRTNKRTMKRPDVSKIVKMEDEETRTEIEVSKILKKIDPHQKYFLHVKDYCKLRQIPETRSNISSVRYLDRDMTISRSLDNVGKKLDKKYCEIDLRFNPINMILSDGGFELKDVMDAVYIGKVKANKYKMLEHFKLGNAFFFNFKNQFQHLLRGIYKLHTNGIVNRDVKLENLMIDYTSIPTHDNGKTKIEKNITVRYIDFGLSEIITPSYRASLSNMHAIGTPSFYSPEIIICSTIKNYRNYNRNDIMKLIKKEYTRSVIEICKELHLDYSNLDEITVQLLDSIYEDFKTRAILPKYFGTEQDKLNGYVQKTDVYALGMTVYEMINSLPRHSKDSISRGTLLHNVKLQNLLKNMIAFHPDSRYNILQCLQHPYFN